MPFKPEEITKEHVLLAINKIEKERIHLNPSTGYDVIINGKPYPPKEVMRHAHEQQNGELIWELTGGEPTNVFLRNLGFEIRSKAVESNYLTGTVLKLGTNWGRGAPSFYSLIKDKRIVIGNVNFEIGHLVAITEGFTVRAIARVVGEMAAVTKDPSLEKPFEELSIDYEDYVNFAKADWYELPPAQIFEYQLMAGIREIRDPVIKERLQLLWQNRHNTQKPSEASSDSSSYQSETSSPLVKEIQSALKAKNLYHGNVDGLLSNETVKAVMEFQTSQDLEASGIVDKATLAKLNILPGPSLTGSHNNYWLWRIRNPNFFARRIGEKNVISTPIKDLDNQSLFSNIDKDDKLLVFDFENGKNITLVETVTEITRNNTNLNLSVEISEILPIPVQLSVFEIFVANAREIADEASQRSLFPMTQSEASKILAIGRGNIIPERNIIYNELKKACLDNDEAFAPKDYLGFDKDIRAFAALMAMKDVNPPLAIAIFGIWGAGKSFFMHHLKTTIQYVSNHQTFPVEGEIPQASPGNPKPFCEGIVQISFNAWSYLDSNLWAGLVTTILEKLDRYVSDYSKGSEAKKRVHQQLSNDLKIVSEQKKYFLSEIGNLEQRKETIETQIRSGELQRGHLLQNVKNKTFKHAYDEAIARLGPIPDELKTKLKAYGITESRLEELSPERLFEEVKSWSAFLSNVLKFRTRDRIMLTLLILSAGYLVVDPLDHFAEAKDTMLRGLLILVTTTGPLFMKGYNAFAKYRDLWQPVLRLKNKFNLAMAEAEYDHRIQLQLLETELGQNEERLENLRTELITVDDKIQGVQYSLNNSITRIAFDNFIRERRGDINYEKHLGIISTIRRDFETLSELFHETIQAGDNASLNTNHIESSNKDTDTDHPKKTGQLRQYFTKPLDRIILYIDDLDRCPDDKVMDVLQAVHLLMAFPLFIVVVGVDKRCVHNALMHRNLIQYKGYFNGGSLRSQLKKNGIDVIEPSEYLEKIFQIPFHIEEPKPKKIRQMVQNLLIRQVRIHERGKETYSQKQAISDANATEQATIEETATENIKSSHDVPEKEQPLRKLSPDDLLLDEDEYLCLVEIITLVSRTPRTIKRFINMYRIIRAHELLSYDKGTEHETFMAIMFTVALSTGDYRDRTEKLFEEMLQKPNISVQAALSQQTNCKEIIDKISDNEKLKPLLSMKCERAADCIHFTRRFSFNG